MSDQSNPSTIHTFILDLNFSPQGLGVVAVVGILGFLAGLLF